MSDITFMQGTQKIYLGDYAGLGADDAIAKIEMVTETILASGDTDIWLLVDITGTYIVPTLLDAFKKSAISVKDNCTRTAVIGLGTAKKILFDAVVKLSGINARACKSKEEALSWLTE